MQKVGLWSGSQSRVMVRVVTRAGVWIRVGFYFEIVFSQFFAIFTSDVKTLYVSQPVTVLLKLVFYRLSK